MLQKFYDKAGNDGDYVGFFQMENKKAFFFMSKKPGRFKRLMYLMLLGWSWHDGDGMDY